MTTTKTKHVPFDDQDIFETNACNFIVDIANKSIQQNGIFRIVLCGGSTPKSIYAKLKDQKIPFCWILLFAIKTIKLQAFVSKIS